MKEPTEVEERLLWQAEWCERLGSPLYAGLLRRAADDRHSGGPVRQVLLAHEKQPSGAALGLRFLGAVHRLALAGKAPEIARRYPSCGGDGDLDGAWDAVRDALAARPDDVSNLVGFPVQTNEVGRSAPLLCGFLRVARRTQLPLRVLEVGASGGLNLRWDHFLYEAAGWSWGKPDSRLKLARFAEPPPPSPEVTVVERRGCDKDPVDMTTDEGRLTLRSYVWADQLERFRLLDAALEVAARVPATVDQAAAVEWLPHQLATPPPGVTTVVYHSIVWQYLAGDEQAAIRETMESAGLRATDTSPLAWVSFEPGGDAFQVRLRFWPGDVDEVVASASAHGDSVRCVS